tara:strand:+ start:328 stop:546 length:219 start_codon:yes stop_codon:yes gene_type:complete
LSDRPQSGDIWAWHPDDSRCDEIYGAGIVLGWREGYDDSGQQFITFHFGSQGIMNLPVDMVYRFMYKTQSKK